MLRAQGYATFTNPDAESGQPALIEYDTVTCHHCQGIVFVKPGTGATTYVVRGRDGVAREEPGAFCRVCMQAVCLKCCDDGRCTPFERRLELAESRARLLRAVGVG